MQFLDTYKTFVDTCRQLDAFICIVEVGGLALMYLHSTDMLYTAATAMQQRYETDNTVYSFISDRILLRSAVQSVSSLSVVYTSMLQRQFITSVCLQTTRQISFARRVIRCMLVVWRGRRRSVEGSDPSSLPLPTLRWWNSWPAGCMRLDRLPDLLRCRSTWNYLLPSPLCGSQSTTKHARADRCDSFQPALVYRLYIVNL